MLAALNLSSLDDLVNKTVPGSILSKRPLDLAPARGERATGTYLRHMRHRNQVFTSMIGCGYHGTVMPPVIKRNVFENPDWYTAYTPIRLKSARAGWRCYWLSTVNYRSHRHGYANASLLDEATAAPKRSPCLSALPRPNQNGISSITTYILKHWLLCKPVRHQRAMR
ncbi:MAG: hypothetical protein CM1200mP41_37460 [Gammaproteobacteria bacterium]|nr:MAG: hypothetical protein CM1200mP41_37460 [Gammaproteobacteria bacterium]